jgi:hypothetical protein
MGPIMETVIKVGGGHPDAVALIPEDRFIYAVRVGTLIIPALQAMFVGAILGVLLTHGGPAQAVAGGLALALAILLVDITVLRAKGWLWVRVLMAVVIAVVLSIAAMPGIFSGKVIAWKKDQLTNTVVAEAKAKKDDLEIKKTEIEDYTAQDLADFNPRITGLIDAAASAQTRLDAANAALKVKTAEPAPQPRDCGDPTVTSSYRLNPCYAANRAEIDAASTGLQDARTEQSAASKAAIDAAKARDDALEAERAALLDPVNKGILLAQYAADNPETDPKAKFVAADYAVSDRILDAFPALDHRFHFGVGLLMLMLDLMVVVAKVATHPRSEEIAAGWSDAAASVAANQRGATQHQLDEEANQRAADALTATTLRQIRHDQTIQSASAAAAAEVGAQRQIADLDAQELVRRHRDQLAAASPPSPPSPPPVPTLSPEPPTPPPPAQFLEGGAKPTPPAVAHRREVFRNPNLEFRVDKEKAFEGGHGVLHLATGADARVLVKVPKNVDDGIPPEEVPAYLEVAQNELGLYETFAPEIGTKLYAFDHPTGRIAVEYHPRGSLDRYLGIDPESTHINVDFTLAELLTVLEQVIRFDSVLWVGGYTYLDSHAGNYVLCGTENDHGLLTKTPPQKSTQSGALRAIDFGTVTPIGQKPKLGPGPLMPPEYGPHWIPRGDLHDWANPLWDVFQIGRLTGTLLNGGGWGPLAVDTLDAEPVQRLAQVAQGWMSAEPFDRAPGVDFHAPVWRQAVADSMTEQLIDIRRSLRPGEGETLIMNAGDVNHGRSSERIVYL